MRIAAEDRPIERVGITTERSFSIKATGKAFRILSSGLYKNKIRAIVRELSCNAYDANVAAGKPNEPFHIHLPNMMEPFFSIRDDGIGLSDTDMFSIYTTYFESTKTERDDMIGAFGLGSKAPFSYVDSFTVVSRFAGMKRTYTAFIAEDGMPALVRLTEEITTDCNGIEVIIPVNSKSDFRDFAHEASSVLAYFDPQPNITGDGSFKVDTRKILLRGNGWELVSRSSGSKCSYAIMGTVAYPISTYSISGLDAAAVNILENATVDIHFGIGDLDITAGREDLSYDPKLTNAKIIEKAKQICEEIPKLISDMFVGCKTEYDARKKYGDLFEKPGALGEALPKYIVDWNGKKINSGYFHVDMADVGSGLIRFNMYGGVIKKRTIPDDGMDIQADDSAIIVRNDLTRGAHSRIRHYIKKNPRCHVFLFCGTDEYYDEFAKILDGFDIKDASKLEKPQLVKKKTAPDVSILSDKGKSEGSAALANLIPVSVDMEDGGYYIVTYSRRLQGVSRREDFRDIYRAAIKYRFFDPNQEELYFVPSTVAKKFENNPKWKPFFATMKDAAVAKLASYSEDIFIEAKMWTELLSQFGNLSDYRELFKRVAKSIPDETHAVRAIPSNWAAFEKAYNDQKGLFDLASSFNLAIKTTYTKNRLLDELNAFEERYPMLSYMMKQYGYRTAYYASSKMLTTYIKLVDSQTGSTGE